MSDDFDKYEINEYEDQNTKTYHCIVKHNNQSYTFGPYQDLLKFLDKNGISSIQPKKRFYQVMVVFILKTRST